jgi:hypothetical protein
LVWIKKEKHMDAWTFSFRMALLALIGTLSGLAIAAVATIGGLYLFWPAIGYPYTVTG